MGIRPDSSGVSVHDGFPTYHRYTTCRPALCTSHHLRELTFRAEQYHPAWATQLKVWLLEMTAATAQTRAEGRRQLPTAIRQAVGTRYQALLAAGLAAGPAANPLPAPARRPHQRGRVKQTPAQHLLERLWLGQEPVLGIWAFLDDLTIPFDNNQAERDRRTLKLQQKVSGCFRSDPGADAFARLRSYLATLRKQGQPLFAALQTVFAGRPLYPALG
jgi:transposase